MRSASAGSRRWKKNSKRKGIEMNDKQPEALRLADDCEGIGETDGWPQLIESAAELRRLHQENEKLREAGVGYSQQTMDAVVREREELRRLNAELLVAIKHCRNAIQGGTPFPTNDHRGAGFQQDFGVAFVNYLNSTIAKAEGK